jgi:hypothetical protein
MMDLSYQFNKISQQMNTDLEQIRDAYKQSSDLRGTQFEETFRKFLRLYLPRKLELSTGTIIDSNGLQSKQLDIIVSDYSRAPILFEDKDIRTLPIECVYSVIEVKAKLDIKETEKCLANMKSVRQLEKKAYYKRKGAIEITHDMYGQSYLIPPVTYFIFAFDSINLTTLRDYINTVHNREQLPVHNRIDSVCVLNKGVIYNRLKNGMYSALPEPDSVLVSHETRKPLLLFYTLIMHYLCQSDMPDFKFIEYLGKAFLF